MATRFDECVAFINSARDANGMHTHVARARAHMPPSDCESKAKQPSLYLKPSTTQPTPPLPHTPGRVLVHCRGGVSRSSTVVVGYLMAQARSRVSTPPNPPTSKPIWLINRPAPLHPSHHPAHHLLAAGQACSGLPACDLKTALQHVGSKRFVQPNSGIGRKALYLV